MLRGLDSFACGQSRLPIHHLFDSDNTSDREKGRVRRNKWLVGCQSVRNRNIVECTAGQTLSTLRSQEEITQKKKKQKIRFLFCCIAVTSTKKSPLQQISLPQPCRLTGDRTISSLSRSFPPSSLSHQRRKISLRQSDQSLSLSRWLPNRQMTLLMLPEINSPAKMATQPKS